jgi:hypothetical protein
MGIKEMTNLKMTVFSVTMAGHIRVSLHGYTSLTVIVRNWQEALKFVDNFGDRWHVSTRLI